MDPEFSESSEKKLHDEDGFDEKLHLFGRQNPLHSALGGGKPADVNILWRNKQISAALLAAGSTVIDIASLLVCGPTSPPSSAQLIFSRAFA